MKRYQTVLAFIGILLLGAAIMAAFIMTRPRPRKKTEHASSAILVDTTRARQADEPMRIMAMGTVIPSREVTVLPEVSGRIVHKTPQLVPGGRVRAGQTLIRIDDRDYHLALKQQQALVTQARLQLAREHGLKAVAEQEWKLMADEVQPTKDGRKLALRDIQLENAQAALDAAISSRELARIKLERTVVKAPFNAVVHQEFVDAGQVVNQASRIAILVASDTYWVRVTVPLERLRWLRIPGINAPSGQGSPAHIAPFTGAGPSSGWAGQVLELEAGLDPRGQMARLIVVVPNPRQQVATGDRAPCLPLLLEARVQVELEGPLIKDAVMIPTRALRDHDKVWLATSHNTLAVRQVTVLWTREPWVAVRGDIRPDDIIITSPIAAPVDGMSLALNGATDGPWS